MLEKNSENAIVVTRFSFEASAVMHLREQKQYMAFKSAQNIRVQVCFSLLLVKQSFLIA